ncbi:MULTISPECIES: TetR/AcrR family transcriptional regulator [unclassified Amycolatopsis]|uniref:TetR/AcrR family transcriptional regulator n=1 Tax=unclassified Amycolatopsis TaxID=2618356 RepID=UPI00056C2401|nr:MULTISPECIES: TetR/AcrR family transcriptional regulator [unclassified Amycolatopsis]MCG3750484.1 TetR/AcrR family transcriptional regulator [Amycolatopsis sp. Poz14]
MSETSEGFRPPQQARSRAALQRLLTAAEQVLAEQGLESFTVAAVASQAGMSVGTIYRRFDGKEQLLHAVKDRLLTQLETSVRDALRSAPPDLRSIFTAFVAALAQTFEEHDGIFPELLDAQRSDGRDRGLAALSAIQDALLEALPLSSAEVENLKMAARTIIGACVHRAATSRFWPDDRPWETWAEEAAEMALAYLTSPPTGPARM